jgi:2'-5' RNA ligase
MVANGLRPSPHIVPHVTLSYGREPVPMQPIAPIVCAVAYFVLIHYERGLGRHNIVGRWTLGGEPIPVRTWPDRLSTSAGCFSRARFRSPC